MADNNEQIIISDGNRTDFIFDFDGEIIAEEYADEENEHRITMYPSKEQLQQIIDWAAQQLIRKV